MNENFQYPPIVQVNKNGKVVGPIAYDIAHPKVESEPGIRHATVNGLIFDTLKCERVLRSMRGGTASHPGKWDSSFGGHLDWIVVEDRPEIFDEAAERELKEELFYGRQIPETLKLGRIDKFWKITRPNNPELVGLYTGIYNGEFFPNPAEVSEVSFEYVEKVLEDLKINPQSYTKSIGVCLNRFCEIKRGN